MISKSDLILNPDHSIYHLNLHPEELADTIILVGDKDRVGLISSLFDKTEVRKEKREFITHTGYYRNKRLSILSTGIGTDNIDIVVNEIDALKNIDLQSFEPKQKTTQLNFIRIGTCGAIHPENEPGSAIVSRIALGLDNLNHFYNFRLTDDELVIREIISQHLSQAEINLPFYIQSSSQQLFDLFSSDYPSGITVTAPGFYAPQGRVLRLQHPYNKLVDIFANFNFQDFHIVNFEMESSALFGLSRLFRHQALTINLVIANRHLLQVNVSYHQAMLNLAGNILDKLVQLV